MANAGASIEAVLTLNATGFQQGITKSVTALDKFATAISKLKNTDGRLAIQNLTTALLEFNTALRQVELMNKSAINTFSKLSSAVNKMANGLKLLQSDELNLVEAVNTMNNIFKAFQGVLSGTEVKVKELKIANDSLVASQRQVASTSTQESASIEKDAVSKDKATASTKRLENANKTLSSSFSMLRSAVTLVGSMIAYNFVHNLAMATTETINAKSEMNGYFQMLGYGKTQVDDFNRALDETVKKFPRLNKYALGETISSIGVEFELTTAEMKKAMPVVSMITSEYLRAGRNVNEASLAVKDILQGEFQRLSRETGVKGDQLKEAGWSGDKSDVMGLLEALDKVGKDRNWDKFVAKANSLNDAVLIMQNRFSEWSADMVERFQPAIVGAFNDIMVVADSFGKVVNGALDWLGGNGLAQSIVKWGGLATVLTTVTLALIHYRTGANLVQIAQMGLTKSIGATILGLEAETVAEYGLRNAIALKVTGIEAETLANEKNIITRKVRLQAIISSITGIELETIKQYGLLKSILATASGMEVEKFASMGLKEQLLAVAGSLGVVAGALAIVTGYLIIQAVKINDTTEKYKKFVHTLEHGDEIISEAKDTYDNLSEKSEKLSAKLETLTKGTYEYNKANNELATIQDDVNTAFQNYKDAVDSVAWVQHKQDLYDTIKQEKSLETQKAINEALIEYGVNIRDANQLSSELWQDAEEGWEVQYETLQKINLQMSKNQTTVEMWLKRLSDAGKDPKEIPVLIKPIIRSGNKIKDAKEELGQATSLTEYVDKWLWLQYQQIKYSFDEFKLNLETFGWAEAIGGLFRGLAHGIDDMGIGSFLLDFDLWKMFDDWMTEQLNNFNANSGDWGNRFVEVITEAFTHFDLLGAIWDAITPDVAYASDGSSDHPSPMDDISRELSKAVGSDIQQWINEFPSNVMAYISGGAMNIVDFISNLFTIDTNGIYEWVQTNIIQLLIDAVTQGIQNTPILGDIAKLLGLGDNPEQEAHDKGWSVGDNFNIGISNGLSGVSDIINNAFNGLNLDDITSSFLSNTSTMTENARITADGVSTSFSGMKDKHKASVDTMSSNNSRAFTDMQVKSNQQMLAMRDSTSKTTQQMTSAWDVMKDSILASAKKIRDDSTTRFTDLSTTIGGFYRKIQNPSLWGSAGSPSLRQGTPNRRVGRSFASALRPNGYAGGSYYSGSKTMSIGALKNKLCPTGDCDGIFDGYNSTDIVNVNEFIASITGEHGFGGWNFAQPHNQYIKDKSDKWDTAPPIIQLLGGIATQNGFKVGEFNNGTPQVSFSTFQSIAESIFSAIPYRLYYDSSWKGSWLGALQAGACNCYDGALALMALARTFGFSASMAHGTWNNADGRSFGHVWAIINGHKMDTTGWQQGRTWTPSQSAGGYMGRASGGSDGGKTLNITIDMSDSTFYGMDDFEQQVREASRKVMREEFTDPYTIAL